MLVKFVLAPEAVYCLRDSCTIGARIPPVFKGKEEERETPE